MAGLCYLNTPTSWETSAFMRRILLVALFTEIAKNSADIKARKPLAPFSMVQTLSFRGVFRLDTVS
jgi:hypothetical protein